MQPHSQQPVTGPYPQPNQSIPQPLLPSISNKPIDALVFHVLSSVTFSHHTPVLISLLPMHATFPAHLILLDIMTITTQTTKLPIIFFSLLPLIPSCHVRLFTLCPSKWRTKFHTQTKQKLLHINSKVHASVPFEFGTVLTKSIFTRVETQCKIILRKMAEHQLVTSFGKKVA